MWRRKTIEKEDERFMLEFCFNLITSKKTKNLGGEKGSERSRERWREEWDVEEKDSRERRRKILCENFVNHIEENKRKKT